MAADKLPPKPFNLLPIWLSALVAVLWMIIRDLELDFQALRYGAEDIAEYFSRYGAPDFSNMVDYMGLMIDTLAIAFWGTALAFMMAFVLAPLAARSLTPNRCVYRIVRELLNFMRAMPDLLLALVFVMAIGLGPMPGVFALAIHSTGFLGKFFAESMERVPAGKYEALAAVGAGFTQTVFFAAWPSILREAAGSTLYILDRNVRMATVLGLVGAGGIGSELIDSLRMFRYEEAAALMIIILAVIIAIDNLSSTIRKAIQ